VNWSARERERETIIGRREGGGEAGRYKERGGGEAGR